jgi:hypothetical protein
MLDEKDVDAFAVLNWLVKYYERGGMTAKAQEIRAEIDRVSEKIRQSQEDDAESTVVDLAHLEL